MHASCSCRGSLVLAWLLIFAVLVAGLVVFGGYVRLSRAGLSIVEWQPVRGVLPPIGEAAWQAEFAKYQQSPEYQKINAGMTLPAFRRIFLIEWWHRLIARLAGLAYLLPALWLMGTGRIPAGQRGPYLVLGGLFLGQALMGWLMVASGLVDRPAVSHLRLTAHLLLALVLFSLTLWQAARVAYGPVSWWGGPWSWVAWVWTVYLGVLVLQMAYGGLVAGLKAGYLADTWPKLFGRFLPPAMMETSYGGFGNWLNNPVAVLWVHRWLGAGLLLLAVPATLLVWKVTRQRLARLGAAATLAALLGQFGLGLLVTYGQMSLPMALLHQAWALVLLAASLFTLFHLREPPEKVEWELPRQEG